MSLHENMSEEQILDSLFEATEKRRRKRYALSAWI